MASHSYLRSIPSSTLESKWLPISILSRDDTSKRAFSRLKIIASAFVSSVPYRQPAPSRIIVPVQDQSWACQWASTYCSVIGQFVLIRKAWAVESTHRGSAIGRSHGCSQCWMAMLEWRNWSVLIRSIKGEMLSPWNYKLYFLIGSFMLTTGSLRKISNPDTTYILIKVEL